MIRSQARQRTTPSTAGVGPSSTMRREKPCTRRQACAARRRANVDQLRPSLRVEPYHPSRSVCRSMPPARATSSREDPSSTAAIVLVQVSGRKKSDLGHDFLCTDNQVLLPHAIYLSPPFSDRLQRGRCAARVDLYVEKDGGDAHNGRRRPDRLDRY